MFASHFGTFNHGAPLVEGQLPALPDSFPTQQKSRLFCSTVLFHPFCKTIWLSGERARYVARL